MRKCSVCFSNFPNFLPLPLQYFEHFHRLQVPYSLEDFETLNVGQYSCPVCQASDRDRLYALFLRLRYSGNAKPIRILDIAPAPALSRLLKGLPGAVYRSADLYSDLADDRVDITDMRLYADGIFDLIVCSHVLEHVPDDRAAIRELYRVLAPQGLAILMVPILTTLSETDEGPDVVTEEDRWRRFGQGDHVRMYARDDFVARLQAGGFDLSVLAKETFGADVFGYHGIADRSVLYVGHK